MLRLEIQPGDPAWAHAGPLVQSVWPPHLMAELPWRDVVFAHADRRVLVWDGDELVCHVGLYDRDGLWDGRSVRMGGIGGVATREDYRQQGAASAAMRMAADDLAASGGADFGLLFCEPHNFAFYRGLGWHRFEGTAMVEQPRGRVALVEMTPFVLDVTLAPRAGIFDLRGLPW